MEFRDTQWSSSRFLIRYIEPAYALLTLGIDPMYEYRRIANILIDESHRRDRDSMIVQMQPARSLSTYTSLCINGWKLFIHMHLRSAHIFTFFPSRQPLTYSYFDPSSHTFFRTCNWLVILYLNVLWLAGSKSKLDISKFKLFASLSFPPNTPCLNFWKFSEIYKFKKKKKFYFGVRRGLEDIQVSLSYSRS